jgi:toxin ParE1/3/4
MRMKVTVTDPARLDLQDLGDYIANNSPRRAASFVRQLQRAAQGIGRRPKAWPFADGLETLGIRRRVHGNYLIFFTIDADSVTILRVLHDARDFTRILSPEDPPESPEAAPPPEAP